MKIFFSFKKYISYGRFIDRSRDHLSVDSQLENVSKIKIKFAYRQQVRCIVSIRPEKNIYSCFLSTGARKTRFPNCPQGHISSTQRSASILYTYSRSAILICSACLDVHNSQTNERRALKFGGYIIGGQLTLFHQKKLSYIYF